MRSFLNSIGKLTAGAVDLATNPVKFANQSFNFSSEAVAFFSQKNIAEKFQPEDLMEKNVAKKVEKKVEEKVEKKAEEKVEKKAEEKVEKKVEEKDRQYTLRDLYCEGGIIDIKYITNFFRTCIHELAIRLKRSIEWAIMIIFSAAATAIS